MSGEARLAFVQAETFLRSLVLKSTASRVAMSDDKEEMLLTALPPKWRGISHFSTKSTLTTILSYCFELLSQIQAFIQKQTEEIETHIGFNDRKMIDMMVEIVLNLAFWSRINKGLVDHIAQPVSTLKLGLGSLSESDSEEAWHRMVGLMTDKGPLGRSILRRDQLAVLVAYTISSCFDPVQAFCSPELYKDFMSM